MHKSGSACWGSPKTMTGMRKAKALPRRCSCKKAAVKIFHACAQIQRWMTSSGFPHRFFWVLSIRCCTATCCGMSAKFALV